MNNQPDKTLTILKKMPTVLAVMLITKKAEEVFIFCQTSGAFTKVEASSYNILLSARSYLKTGKPLPGNRTLEFFEL